MSQHLSKRLLSLGGVFIIAMLSGSCNNHSGNNTTSSSTPAVNGAVSTGGVKYAYVNVDTLQEKYAYWKSQADALEAEQAKGEAEIQASAQKLQSDYMELQKKAQSGTLSDAEGQAAQQRLGQMQQSLESRRSTLSAQLQKKQLEFAEQLQKNIDEYLEVYNKEHNYDFIFSYTRAGNILYANKGLDITNDVLKGLNESKSATTDKK